jgi:hypothetical protein
MRESMAVSAFFPGQYRPGRRRQWLRPRITESSNHAAVKIKSHTNANLLGKQHDASYYDFLGMQLGEFPGVNWI